jgi:hypothetical protein
VVGQNIPYVQTVTKSKHVGTKQHAITTDVVKRYYHLSVLLSKYFFTNPNV